MNRPLLEVALPELAAELSDLLESVGQHDLVAQIPHLRLLDRCRCEDAFCATVYTAPRPSEGWGSGHRSMELAPSEGYLILDLVDRKIVCIEVLYRNSVREQLLRLLP
jgi:hypothetical protein